MIATAADIGYLFVSFKTEKGRDVAKLSELASKLIREQGAVGEELEVAVGVFSEYIEELLVDEGFATKDTKVIGALFFALLYDVMDFVDIQAFFFLSGADPATLTF
jgi:hypothetical protein